MEHRRHLRQRWIMPLMKLSPLASHLVYDNLLNHAQAIECDLAARDQSLSLIQYLANNHIVSNESILQSFQKCFGLKRFDLTAYDFKWLASGTLDSKLIRRYQVIPLQQEKNRLHLALADPTNRAIIDAIAFHTGYQVIPVIVPEIDLLQFINTHFSENAQHHLEVNLLESLLSTDSPSTSDNTTNLDEPIIRFVDQLIQHALQQSVSDIHIEPFLNDCRIRYRRDGILYVKAELPSHLASRLSMRLKIMANCDIAERRLPQDGRFQIQSHDIRMNCCPTLFGEKIVLRLLNTHPHKLSIETLELTEPQKSLFLKKISEPQGMVLVTGPTGSGKTTTLYTALHYLNSSEKNISTVEDPVEIQLQGINQVNVHPKIDLHFATVLRTLLRQDPDIIMIGEIRDPETATIATQAALTGHLVLSTLHTKSALEAITRLESMGIATYNLQNSLSLIIAQRLIRKLCNQCKQPEILTQTNNHVLGLAIDCHQTVYRAIGCNHCLQGYQGRIPIYEFLPLNETIKSLLSTGNNLAINKYLQESDLLTLKQSGLDKILSGQSSIAEINRVLST